MSGLASRTVSRSCQRPLKSGMSTSMAVCGFSARTARMVSAQMEAPPSSQLVARDGGDDRVLEAHEPDRLGHAARFVAIELGGAAGLHRAKAAAARADVAEDHDRGRLARPAFAEVRALRAFAHGVELVLVDDASRLLVNRAAGNLGAQPRRLAGVQRERLINGVFHEASNLSCFRESIKLSHADLFGRSGVARHIEVGHAV